MLRPGGVLIGYDLVNAAPARLLRFGQGHGTRMLRPGQLEAELRRLYAVSIRVRPGARHLAVRFAASKAA